MFARYYTYNIGYFFPFPLVEEVVYIVYIVTCKPVTFDKRAFVWMSDLISITMERSMLEDDSALGWNLWRLTSRLLEGGALPLKRV